MQAHLSAIPGNRSYTEEEWEDMKACELSKTKEMEGEDKCYLAKEFERLKKLHTKKWKFGQGDLQEGEEE